MTTAMTSLVTGRAASSRRGNGGQLDTETEPASGVGGLIDIA